MKALGITPVIHVTNLTAALKYYTTVLGFKQGFIFGDYAGLFYNEVCIHLCGPTNPGIKKSPGSALVTIDCDEVDGYYADLQTKGAIIKGPPADQVYGIRDFVVEDLDGNTVVFGKVLE